MKSAHLHIGAGCSQTQAWFANSGLCLLGSFALAFALPIIDGCSITTAASHLFTSALPETIWGKATVTTLGITIGALVIAMLYGFSVAWVGQRIGLGVPVLLGCVGRLLAALPICGVAWYSIGMLFSQCRLPIDSLLTYPAPPELDQWPFTIARPAWAWLTPMLILSLPLFGQWLDWSVTALDTARSRLSIRIDEPQTRASTPHRYLWPTAWKLLLPQLRPLAFTALAYEVIVEHVLGLAGWGHQLAMGIAQHQVSAMAGAVISLGWIATIYSFLTAVLLPKRTTQITDTASFKMEFRPAPLFARIGLLLLCLASLGLFFLAESMSASLGSRVNTAAQFSALFPRYFTEQVFLHLPAFSSDLVHTAMASAYAVLSLLLSRGVLALLRPSNTSPSASRQLPLLLWSLALAGMPQLAPHLDLVLGATIGIAQARAARDYSSFLHHQTFVEVSRSLGVSRAMTWIRHVLPCTMRFHLAWLFGAFGNLLLWRLVFASLATPTTSALAFTQSSLGVSISALSLQSMVHPRALLFPTLLIALVIFLAQQASRFLSLRSLHNSSFLHAPPHS